MAYHVIHLHGPPSYCATSTTYVHTHSQALSRVHPVQDPLLSHIHHKPWKKPGCPCGGTTTAPAHIIHFGGTILIDYKRRCAAPMLLAMYIYPHDRRLFPLPFYLALLFLPDLDLSLALSLFSVRSVVYTQLSFILETKQTSYLLLGPFLEPFFFLTHSSRLAAVDSRKFFLTKTTFSFFLPASLSLSLSRTRSVIHSRSHLLFLLCLSPALYV